MTTPDRGYGTNFRRAEEASNAQGISQAAVDWAFANAAKNPTQENKNIAKDIAAAQMQMRTDAANAKLTAQTGPTTYNQRVENAIKTNTQSGVDVNANPTSPATALTQQVGLIASGLPKQSEDLAKIIAEAESAIAGVNAAGAGVVAAGGSFTPVAPIAKPKTSPFDAASDAILAETLKSYGMEGVAQTIAQIRGEYPEISSDNLLLLLKNDTRYNTEYLKRFAGNAKLKAAGLPTLDDATYLKAEDEYKKIFTAYGATTLATKDYYATLIGNRMDAVDVTNRMNEGYAALKASPDVMNAFKQFYSAATDGDILAILMDEKTQLPIIKQKVAAAEIGGAALAQNLETSLAKANELVGLGVTRATAQAGYSTIAQALPTYEKLLEINSGKDVKTSDAQAKLEASKLKKDARAIAEEQSAIAMEIARFSGSAGRLASSNRASGLV